MKAFLDREAFDLLLLDEIKRFYKDKEDIEVSKGKSIKDNNIRPNYITVRRVNQSIAPVLYTDKYYAEYEEGRSIFSIIGELIEIFENNKPPVLESEIDNIFLFDEIKDNIVVKLINYDLNKERLKKEPYIKLLDLAIVFQILVVKDYDDSYGFIRVTEDFREKWKINTETLYDIALKNTMKLFKPEFRNMKDILSEMISNLASTGQQTLQSMKDDLDMWVLRTQSGVNGASVILYDNLLKSVSRDLGSKLIILPSSIHEVIILKYSYDVTAAKLKEVVCSVNESEVPEQEILSDNVYIYSEEQGLQILE